MKFALCLHGLCGGRNKKGRIIRAIDGYNCIKKHILDKYDVDVFLHSWTITEEQKFVNLYQPKKYLFENNKTFESCNLFNSQYYQSLKSLYYSYQKVNEMKSQYELEMGFTYDRVIHARFDLNIINISVDLTTLETDKIYFIGYVKKKLLDHLWIADSKTMDKFIQLYDLIPTYHSKLKSIGSNNQYLNHDIIHLHAKMTGLDHKLENLNGKFKGGTFPIKKQTNLKVV